MATIANLEVRIGSDIKGLEKGLQRAQRKLQDAGRSMQRVGRTMTMAISAPMAAAGAAALNSAAKFESLQQSMNTLNGSVEEGTRNFERLKEFSATTPFQLRDLAEAQNMLQGFGLSADEAFESMSMIGDIAAVASGDIKGIGIAFGQAAAEGRLMTRDIRQLINQGVPAIKLLSETMGVAESSVLDLASEGEISFEILQQAFSDATSEGGMFADGMAKQARTLGGIWSTFKDNVSIALADVGQAMAEAFDIKGLADSTIATIQSMLESFNDLSKETKQMAFVIAGVLGAGGPILVALGTLTAALGAISWPIVLGVAAIGTATTAIIKNWNSVESYFTSGAGAQMWNTLQGMIERTVDIATTLWNTFGDQIISTTETAFNVVSQVLRQALNTISVMFDVFTGRFLTDWQGFWDDTQAVARDTFGRDGSMTIIFEEFLDWINDSWLGRLSTSLGVGMSNAFISAFNEVSGHDIPFVRSIDKQVAENISFRQSERALRRARKSLLDDLMPDDEIAMPDIDTSGFGVDVGSRIFEDLNVGTAQLSQQTSKAFSSISQTAGAGAQSYIDNLEGMEVAGNEFSSATEAALSDLPSKFEEFVNKSKAAGFDFVSFMSNRVAGAISSFSANIGKMFAGTANEFSTGLEKILLVVTDFASQLADLLIGIGSAIAFVPGLQGNAAAFLAGGAALKALAVGVKSGIEKRIQNRKQRAQDAPELASGGLAFGPTLAVVGDNRGARSNPEVISPLDKLQGMMASSGGGTTRVEGVIRGSDIHLANERGKNKFR